MSEYFSSVVLPCMFRPLKLQGFCSLACCFHPQANRRPSGDQYLRPALTSTLNQIICYPTVVKWLSVSRFLKAFPSGNPMSTCLFAIIIQLAADGPAPP